MRAVTIAGVIAGALMLAPAAAAAPLTILYVGDSLGVGTTPLLSRDLGSAAQIEGDSRIGRPSPEGLRVLEQRVSPADDIVVFDLGTNDDPANPAVLAGDLAAARRASGNACMVVATLNRPPLNGVSVAGLNNAVLAFASGASKVQLVDWNAIVASQPSLLGPDHVHPTPEGYALRAQLFAQAVAECSPGARPQRQTAPATPRHRRSTLGEHAPRPPLKVPGIASSGISFSEPLTVRGRPAQLLLPNTKPPYPAVVMLRAAQGEAEFFVRHGIAVLSFRDRGRPADVRAGVALLRRRREIRDGDVGIWAFGGAVNEAARAAAGNAAVAAVVAISPVVLPAAELRDWRARRALDAAAPAVTTWLRVRARADAGLRADPAVAWRGVAQPVLAVWGTRDDRLPLAASAAALARALTSGPNHDRSFAWVAAPSGAVALEQTARWLQQHLRRTGVRAVLRTPGPPVRQTPAANDVANASFVYAPPLQALWLVVPALMLAAGTMRMRRSLVAAAALAVASAVAIAGGVQAALQHGGSHIATVFGTPWPFALAYVFAAALAVMTLTLARRGAVLAASACLLWLALALFWLL